MSFSSILGLQGKWCFPPKLITVNSCLSLELRFRKDSLGPGHPNKSRIYLDMDVGLTTSGIHKPTF